MDYSAGAAVAVMGAIPVAAADTSVRRQRPARLAWRAGTARQAAASLLKGLQTIGRATWPRP
jgi:hypothetical protein